MKKFTFKGVLDGFRSSVQPQQKPEQEIQETLRPEHFQLRKTFRHGFPHAPTALAYDPIQKLLAIGDKSGSLRILGRPGVDTHVRHEDESACAVLHITFLVNEGALVCATADDTLHLWNFRQKKPQVVQSLKFQREHITCLHLPVASKWLYVGTEKGNIHVVHIETFALSGYVINWNKTIDVLRKSHPGAVVKLIDNPLDDNKLLIAYECGQIVLWDLRARTAEMRWQSAEPLRSVAWHHEGKYFVSSHTDGSLCTWPLRPTPKPQSHSYPHAKTKPDGKLETCKPIHKIDLRTTRMAETFTIFTGGLSMEKGGKSPCITVLQGKGTTVLEMEHPVIDFITMCESPYASEMQEPYAIAVLLENDLVIIDLLTAGFPCYESPYPMDLHESPVTCCTYLSDCPSDLVPAFYFVGRSTARKGGFSDREWPIAGGEWSPASCSYSEIIITGHQDGSIKFWDSSAGTLQVLYKLKTAKIFERARSRSQDESDDDPLAIQLIAMCAESRRLCVAGAGAHVILFKFRKTECTAEFLTLEIPIFYENLDEAEGAECEFSRSLPKSDHSDGDRRNGGMLRVRQGPQRKAAGFQAQLICQTPWTHGVCPGQITALTVNSSYGLMAYGTEHGLVVVDIVQKVCLLNMASPDLYGNQDPYSRSPRSPKRTDNIGDQGRSPSIDQLNSPPISPSAVHPSGYTSSGEPQLLAEPSSAISGSGVRSAGRTPDEDVADAVVTGANRRRSSSVWKGLNIKRRLSKVNTKISSTLLGGDAAARRGTPLPEGGGDLSGVNEVNVDPDMVETSVAAANKSRQQSFSAPHSRKESSSGAEGLDLPELPLEEAIAADESLCDPFPMCVAAGSGGGGNGADRDAIFEPPPVEASTCQIASHSVVHAAAVAVAASFTADSTTTSSTAVDPSNPLIQAPQSSTHPVTSPDDRPSVSSSAAAQEPATAPSTGAIPKDVRFVRSSRPTELCLFDSGPQTVGGGAASRPVPMQRTKRNRMQSVPNIKLNRLEASKLIDIRQREPGATSSGATTAAAMGCGASGATPQPPPPAAATSSSFVDMFKRFNKLDSSFSRSRSSSMCSLENVSAESVTCLAFADSYTKKSEPTTLLPTLWVGTSLGSVLTVAIQLPEMDDRKQQPVVVSIMGGTIFRVKGSILSLSFLDCNGALIPYSYETWRDDNRAGGGGGGGSGGTPTKNTHRMSPTMQAAGGADTFVSDRQFIVITSEKHARVIALPSQNCVYRQAIADTDYAVKAEVISLKDSVCLICYISTGHLNGYSLPSLRPLMHEEFLPLADLSFQTKCKQGIVDPMLSIWGQQLIVHEDTNQISKTFCLSNRGHGLYLATPAEIQKFTVCAEFGQIINEMIGELFIAHDMPEPPKESFFKGLFGGGTRTLDRQELFGETSGKPNRSVAKHIPGAQLQELGQRAGTATSEISRAHMLAMERGEKLSQLEEKTERMHNTAQEFGGTAHNLMLKYKDRKWYQL